MTTAKLFKHGGSQAVRLPKAFRFEGDEVLIEKRGGAVVLRPKAKAMTLGDLVRGLRREFPEADDFPERDQPKKQQERDLDFD
jgi:antitoxin VapB